MLERFRKEFVFPAQAAPSPACHAATVLPLPDGSVLTAWFGGQREGDPSVAVYAARRASDGLWGAPRRVSGNVAGPCWNPVLFARENGEIVLFFKVGATIAGWVTYFVTSENGGDVWSAPAVLADGAPGGRGPVRNKCLRLSDGRVLAPASTEKTKRDWRAFVDISDDDGISWRTSRYLPRVRYRGAYVGTIQPTLWEDPAGVHALLRTNKGAVYRSDSADRGESWSAPVRTAVPNNNSGIDCALDPAGRLWLAHNPVAENWGPRSPLTLSVSTDGGARFVPVLQLELGEGEYSYPALVYANGRLYGVYTWRRRQIRFFTAVLSPAEM